MCGIYIYFIFLYTIHISRFSSLLSCLVYFALVQGRTRNYSKWHDATKTEQISIITYYHWLLGLLGNTATLMTIPTSASPMAMNNHLPHAFFPSSRRQFSWENHTYAFFCNIVYYSTEYCVSCFSQFIGICYISVPSNGTYSTGPSIKWMVIHHINAPLFFGEICIILPQG